MKIEIELNEEIHREARRLIADYAGGTLEEVLCALVEDMAEGWKRPGSWEAAAVCGWMSSHPWPRGSADAEGGLR